MGISKRRKNILFCIMLFSCLSIHSIYAQSSGSYLETRYIQRLVWTGDEYVTKYEVVIEQEENGIFIFVQNEFTEAEFIEISLPPGNYRFRVIPYDFRDLPEPGTEWKVFTILPAPAETPPAAAVEETPVEVLPAEIPPTEVSPEIKPETELPAGETSAAEPDKGKPVNFFISVFYMPSFPLYNELTEPSIPGAAFRFGILFTRPALFKPGIEFAARWNTSSNETDKHTIGAEFNVLIQKPMTNGKTALMLRLGAGLTVFSIPELNTPPLMELFYANIEFSFLWQPLKHLYFETGFAYSHHFTQPEVSGNFRPFIGIGTTF